MKCPNCTVDLAMTHRDNVEIDYCPNCRGLWLDRGELDKILERIAQERNARDEPELEYKYRPQEYGHSKYRKRKSFLSDLFDFD